VPPGFSSYNHDLNRYNSYSWDKRTMVLYPGDDSNATVRHWLTYLTETYIMWYSSHG
jgi:hypothetical protein